MSGTTPARPSGQSLFSGRRIALTAVRRDLASEMRQDNMVVRFTLKTGEKWYFPAVDEWQVLRVGCKTWTEAAARGQSVISRWLALRSRMEKPTVLWRLRRKLWSLRLTALRLWRRVARGGFRSAKGAATGERSA